MILDMAVYVNQILIQFVIGPIERARPVPALSGTLPESPAGEC